MKSLGMNGQMGRLIKDLKLACPHNFNGAGILTIALEDFMI